LCKKEASAVGTCSCAYLEFFCMCR
jgi:hypothetical protein